jgi:hypothetical protein
MNLRDSHRLCLASRAGQVRPSTPVNSDAKLRLARKGKRERQDSVRTCASAKHVSPSLDKSKPCVEFDGMLIGFVDLKPNSFGFHLFGKRQHVRD